MLRIGAKNQLLLWKRERRFSLNFLKGLALALGFHLILLFGLRINSTTNLNNTFPTIAPASVEVDLGIPQVTAQIPSYSPIEQIEPPQLLEMPQFVLERHFFQKVHMQEPDFSKIEEIKYEFLKDLEEDDFS